MAHRLHIVVTIHNERLWTATTFAVNDRITGADAKRARAHANSLHRLLDRLSYGAHAGAARRNGRHAAEVLQALRKATRVTIYVPVELRKRHNLKVSCESW